MAPRSTVTKSARTSRRAETPLERTIRLAPIDDEPETPREKRLVAAGKRDLAAGRVHTLADVKKRLGL